MLLLHGSFIPPASAEIVDVIDYQKSALQNLLTKWTASQSTGKITKCFLRLIC